MAKKWKLGKTKNQEDNESQQDIEEEPVHPKTEIENLIAALETKENIPMLKSSIPVWTTEQKDDNIVDSPSFLESDVKPSVETKLIPESGKILSQKSEKKQYISTGNLFGDIGVFLTELTDSYTQRYDSWENSTNSILGVLRKLQITTSDNTQQLISYIETLQEQINNGLERFRVKRDHVESYSESNHTEVAHMLKKTLDLLALQIKEFKLKNMLNQLILIYTK